MARIHTMEDDITFERVRHLPKRTRVCSVHRQLSWACNKEIELYEKDTRVTTNNIERSKTALQGRYRELAVVKKKLNQNKIENVNRRASCPAVIPGSLKTQIKAKETTELPSKMRRCDFVPGQMDGTEDDTGVKVGDNVNAIQGANPMKRAVSIMDRVPVSSEIKNNDRTLYSSVIIDPNTKTDHSVRRQQSMPAL